MDTNMEDTRKFGEVLKGAPINDFEVKDNKIDISVEFRNINWIHSVALKVVSYTVTVMNEYPKESPISYEVSGHEKLLPPTVHSDRSVVNDNVAVNVSLKWNDNYHLNKLLTILDDINVISAVPPNTDQMDRLYDWWFSDPHY
jgi:hypothetical protein